MNLFTQTSFTPSNGRDLYWKIECEALTSDVRHYYSRYPYAMRLDEIWAEEQAFLQRRALEKNDTRA